MALDVTWLSHAGFILDDGRHQLVVDPFLTGNGLAKQKPADIRCQYIAVTHGHNDHVGDTVAIARANGATLIASWEVCSWASQQGVKKIEPGNPGGRITTDFGFVAFTRACHSSSYDGTYMGNPCGLVIQMGGHTFYHCGDTDLFGDMKLIADIYKPDIAAIPVGDRFTMGPELGARAAELIRPKVVIPIHFGTFPLITSDISAFTPAGVEVQRYEPGQMRRYE